MRRSLIQRSLAVALVVMALAGGVGVWLAKRRPPRPWNVLLVLVDTLRADHLGCYGYPLATSPRLDAFARQSTVFERAISHAPWTKPAVASLMTSLRPNEHGAMGVDDGLPGDAGVTLAEALAERGYDTVAIQSNPFLSAEAGYDRGFAAVRHLNRARGAAVVRHLMAQLRRRRGRPFFAYVHLMDVHLPYRPPAPYRRLFDRADYVGRFPGERIDARPEEIRAAVGGLTAADRRHVVALYDAAIRYADAQFGSIEDALRATGMWDDTVVVVVADHGEELFDHGSFEHGHTLYNELLHVPLLIRVPGRSGQRVAELVGLVDVYPTLFGVLGFPQPPSAVGRNLSFLLRRGAPHRSTRASAFSTGLLYPARGAAVASVQTATRKLIRLGGETPRDLLYDLVADPHEQQPMAASAGAMAYRRLLQDRLEARRRGRGADRLSLDPRTRRRLKSLGYLR